MEQIRGKQDRNNGKADFQQRMDGHESGKKKEEQERQAGNGNGWRGSYTVEAAMVVPMTVLVLCGLLILAFYVHDSGVFQGMACEAAAVGSSFATEKERKEAAGKGGKTDASRFLGSRNIQRNVACTEKESTARYTASYPIPGLAVRYFGGGEQRLEKSWEIRTINPAQSIWLIRGVKRIIDGGSR